MSLSDQTYACNLTVQTAWYFKSLVSQQSVCRLTIGMLSGGYKGM